MLEELLKKLSASKRTWPKVAEASGVPISTLRKIAQGHTKNPGIKHVEALANYFAEASPLPNPELKQGKTTLPHD